MFPEDSVRIPFPGHMSGEESFIIAMSSLMAVSLIIGGTIVIHCAGSWEAKGGVSRKLRFSAEQPLTVVSESGNPHGLTSYDSLRRRTGGAGKKRKERAEEYVHVKKDR